MPITKSFAGLSMLGLGMMPFGDFESIATVTVGSGGASSIEFTSIPSTYQHLQVRWVSRSTRSFTTDAIVAEINGDTGSNYTYHLLYGNGTSVSASGVTSQSAAILGNATGASAASDIFASGITDILDYASTSKNTVIRTLSGQDRNGTGILQIFSNLWISTNAITSIELKPNVGPNFAEHSTAALFGVKA